MIKLQRLKNLDITILIIVLLLTIIGAINVFSTTYFPEKEPSNLFFNQLLFYGIGFLLLLLISCLDFRIYQRKVFQLGVFISIVTLLILVLLIGQTVFGARRWILIGNFALQPSELAKLGIIFHVAYFLSNSRKLEEYKESKFINKLLEYVQAFKDKTPIKVRIKLASNYLLLIPALVYTALTILQNSLGNTLLIMGIFVLTSLVSIEWEIKLIGYIVPVILGLNLGLQKFTLPLFSKFYLNLFGVNLHLTSLIFNMTLIILIAKLLNAKSFRYVLVFIISIFAFALTNYAYNNILQDYQRTRIESFLDITGDKSQSENWNREQSLIACGSGKAFGKGFLNGTQSNYKLLPFSFTDFAFCGFVEQFGAAGALILLLLIFTLIARLIIVGSKVRNRFGAILINGVAIMITLNTLQHVAMNLGMAPITGVPLPFISYGGSSLMIALVSIGIVQSVITISEHSSKVEKRTFAAEARYH